MKVWQVMLWDYSGTCTFGVFDSIEAVIAKYPDKTNGPRSHRHEWVQHDDTTWEQTGTQGLSAELVEVETLNGLNKEGEG